MKPTLHTTHRARQALAYGLAAMLTVTAASGQTADSDALRRLQEENANLRKQLAAMEGKAPAAAQATPAATSAEPTAARPSLAAEPSDPDTLVLSPFTVRSDKDYGYLKTNSATATRIGTEIQKVPLNISVISEDFIRTPT
jgi:outer membrane receptor protein involved in Fe transport